VPRFELEETVVDNGNIDIPPHMGHGAQRARADIQHSIVAAVELLQIKHEVRAASAYTILVQASVDNRMSIRDTATSIVEASNQSASLRPMTAEEENIIELLSHRDVIGQALEILMTRHGVSSDAALEMLVRGSSASNQEVREIAMAIVRRASA
jgi:AmiR/NasT family two-component response regulator